jgi:hypothetical protein
MWFSGGGTQPYRIIGITDDLGFSREDDRAHVHDIPATVLQRLGLDLRRLTFRFQ